MSRNVAKSRWSFYFSCNSQRNNCSCKMGCYTRIFSCNLRLLSCKLQEKLLRVNNEGNFFRCVCARAKLRTQMTRKPYPAGMRNAILRNHLKIPMCSVFIFITFKNTQLKAMKVLRAVLRGILTGNKMCSFFIFSA